MKVRAFILTLIALVTLSGSLLAQAPAETPAEDKPVGQLAPETKLTPRTTTQIFTPEKPVGTMQLTAYFAVLVLLAAAGFFFLRRGLTLRAGKGGESNLRLLETKMLGNRQFLVVVQYEDNKMLLGVGPGQIQYLCPLDSADADMERLIRESGGTPPPPAAGTP